MRPPQLADREKKIWLAASFQTWREKNVDQIDFQTFLVETSEDYGLHGLSQNKPDNVNCEIMAKKVTNMTSRLASIGNRMKQSFALGSD